MMQVFGKQAGFDRAFSRLPSHIPFLSIGYILSYISETRRLFEVPDSKNLNKLVVWRFTAGVMTHQANHHYFL